MHRIAGAVPPTRRTAYGISRGHYQRPLVLVIRAGLVLLVLLVAGCAAQNAAVVEDDAWDGRWVGYFGSSVGPLGCPLRGVMDVAVEAGRLSGGAHGENFVIVVTGAVGETGAIEDGVFRRDNRAVAIMTGTFGASSAAGRWQGASCEGIWSLQRFR